MCPRGAGGSDPRPRYRQVDLEDAGAVAGVIGAAGPRPLAASLALPPSVFPVIITALNRVPLEEYPGRLTGPPPLTGTATDPD
jgi:hypothetical protein